VVCAFDKIVSWMELDGLTRRVVGRMGAPWIKDLDFGIWNWSWGRNRGAGLIDLGNLLGYSRSLIMIIKHLRRSLTTS
jgi:hypothetical protein